MCVVSIFILTVHPQYAIIFSGKGVDFMHHRQKTGGRVFFIFAATFASLAAVGLCAMFCLNSYVKRSVKSLIISPEDAAEYDADCIIILGCKVKDDGVPSDMLRDRLTRGIELYRSGAAPKLLMSGDHGRETYNEVGAMKQYAIDAGVPSEDVFMDHAGFSTYETMYRARDIFGAKKVVIVTQKYHIYRSLYVAKNLGLDAVGVTCDYETYRGQFKRDAREVLARCKDALMCVLKPEPKYLGDAIPVSGNGDITND